MTAPTTNYTFTRDQLARLLGDTIGMFQEYRDQHGRDEEAAALAAVDEMLGGVEAERDLVRWGDMPRATGQVFDPTQDVA